MTHVGISILFHITGMTAVFGTQTKTRCVGIPYAAALNRRIGVTVNSALPDVAGVCVYVKRPRRPITVKTDLRRADIIGGKTSMFFCRP